MSKPGRRFVGRAEAGEGWRVWDKQQRRFWGERYQDYPEQLLAELNGGKRPERVNELLRKSPRQRP